jgi:hypothetical protein
MQALLKKCNLHNKRACPQKMFKILHPKRITGLPNTWGQERDRKREIERERKKERDRKREIERER